MSAADWDLAPPAVEDRLILDLDGFEGPMDVLLALAKDQKVDLARISLVALVDQYLAFVQRARRLRLELAAEYLVMAAWLAYLKSRLLLPEPPAEEAEQTRDDAARLLFRLEQMEAMRGAAARLAARPRLGVDVFGRAVELPPPATTGDPQAATYDVTLFDLMAAYARQRRAIAPALRIAPTGLYSVEQALERFALWLGRMPEWRALATFLPPGLADPLVRRSAIAATFAAALELARSGRAELTQSAPFAPIYLRSP